MHLIFFPLLTFLLIGIPVLLFWPARGISVKNYSLIVAFPMLGLAVGFITMTILSLGGFNAFFLYTGFVVFPPVFATVGVVKFGNEGIYITSKESILYKRPLKVLLSGALSMFTAFSLVIFIICFVRNKYNTICIVNNFI